MNLRKDHYRKARAHATDAMRLDRWNEEIVRRVRARARDRANELASAPPPPPPPPVRTDPNISLSGVAGYLARIDRGQLAGGEVQ